ncbi:hypothetical protein T08_15514 [Trichinella sp. T8]|nr:hypothetical protein T08_15514 [Trichinella sp. T8]
MKNPIVMPRKHPVTRLVIRSTHNDIGHLGVNSTKAELGRRFFIPKCVSTVKHEIYKCKVCWTHRPIAVQVPTAPLHVNRLQYRLSCVEWTLLLHLSSPGSRKGGVSFSCASQQELFISTNVESFLLALERFIQRCGKPQSIRSDQGTSFVKAAKEQDKSVKALAEELECQVQDKWRIHFKFNPPGAPHWGGSWERMEAFRTLIVRVEGILNRRPITIDENGHSVCPMDIVSPGNKETQGFPREASILEVLRQVRQAAQRFWKRWYQSGDTVLLKEGSNPLVDSYIAAKVVEVFRSNDGYVRSAMLKTANGKEVVRDIRRISIMEGPALERMKMPVVPSASGGVSHPELVKSVELTATNSEARNEKLHSTLFLLQLHRPDEQPDRHMHLTYPWPPVALVTAVLRGILASGASSIDSKFSDITCKSAAVNLDANFLSLQPTVYNPSHSAMTTTKKFLGSAGPRSTSGTLSVQF